MSFEELSHTADVKIRVRARSVNDLFADTCDALMQVMYGSDRRGGTPREIRLESSDIESLLFDFLSEVLFISEVEGLVFARPEVRVEEFILHAVLEGEPFDPSQHTGGTEVKGISYSGLSISQDANGYMLDILFDV